MSRPVTRPAGEGRVIHRLHGTLSIHRPIPGVIFMKFEGCDVGEFGDTPFQELGAYLPADSPIRIFVDARDASASLDVSAGWARWMTANRQHIGQLNMLCGSRFVEMTASFVQRFTQLGERMRIFRDAGAFQRELEAALRPL